MSMAGFLSTTNLARTAKIVALLFFLLPWLTVSCSSRGLDQLGGSGASTATADVPIASASGAQLAIGSISYADSVPFGAAAGEVSDLFDKPNWGVAGAALLILLSFAADFLPNRVLRASVAIIGIALAAAALGYTILFRIP